MTDDDLRAEYIRAMGPDLGSLCHELQNDFAWLQRKWLEFSVLFQGGEPRIALLNATAPNFFHFLNNLLYEDAMLHIARLTDPPESFGNRNLSVKQLAVTITDPGLRSYVELATSDTLAKCDFARTWRNKRLAHADLESLRRGNASGLPSVTQASIDGAIDSLRSLLRFVDKHYGMVPYLSAPDPWGAKALAHFLEKGLKAVKASDRF